MRHHPGGDRRTRAADPRLGAAEGDRLSSPLPAATLYVCATPIGNLEDVTLRALRVFREADLVAAEDTRRTRALLAAHGVTTPLVSYFEHNKVRRGPELVRRLQGGARVALVTDAGTPGISDPGFHLVRLCREAAIRVVPVPGPSAVIAALSVSGIPGDRFVFEGFLPQRPGRRLARLRELVDLARPVVLYESPHRVAATLAALGEVFGSVEVVLARELTKQFEEVRWGTPAELGARVGEGGLRGEVTLVVNPRVAASEPDDRAAVAVPGGLT